MRQQISVSVPIKLKVYPKNVGMLFQQRKMDYSYHYSTLNAFCISCFAYILNLGMWESVTSADEETCIVSSAINSTRG